MGGQVCLCSSKDDSCVVGAITGCCKDPETQILSDAMLTLTEPFVGSGCARMLPASLDDRAEVRLACSEIFQIAGMSAYHTSVVIGEVELYFHQSGIEFTEPYASHMHDPGGYPDIDVQSFGRGKTSGSVLLMQLGPLFEAGTYDIIYKNCNAFTDVALYFLTRKRLDSKYSRLERFVRATTPVSTGVLNGLVRAVGATGVPEEYMDGEEFEPWMYRSNPRAQNFVVEDAIAACNAMDGDHGRTAEASSAYTNAAAGLRCCHCPPCIAPMLSGKGPQGVSRLPEQLPEEMLPRETLEHILVEDDGQVSTAPAAAAALASGAATPPDQQHQQRAKLFSVGDVAGCPPPDHSFAAPFPMVSNSMAASQNSPIPAARRSPPQGPGLVGAAPSHGSVAKSVQPHVRRQCFV